MLSCSCGRHINSMNYFPSLCFFETGSHYIAMTAGTMYTRLASSSLNPDCYDYKKVCHHMQPVLFGFVFVMAGFSFTPGWPETYSVGQTDLKLRQFFCFSLLSTKMTCTNHHSRILVSFLKLLSQSIIISIKKTIKSRYGEANLWLQYLGGRGRRIRSSMLSSTM